MVLVSRHTIGLNMLDAGTRTACQLPGVCFQTYSKEGCANSRCYRRNNRASANEKVRIEDFGGGEVSSNGVRWCGGNIRGRILYLDREDPNNRISNASCHVVEQSCPHLITALGLGIGLPPGETAARLSEYLRDAKGHCQFYQFRSHSSCRVRPGL